MVDNLPKDPHAEEWEEKILDDEQRLELLENIDWNLYAYGTAIRQVEKIIDDFSEQINRGAKPYIAFGMACVDAAREVSRCGIPWSVAKDDRINPRIVKIVAVIMENHPEAKRRASKEELVREAIRAQFKRIQREESSE